MGRGGGGGGCRMANVDVLTNCSLIMEACSQGFEGMLASLLLRPESVLMFFSVHVNAHLTASCLRLQAALNASGGKERRRN